MAKSGLIQGTVSNTTRTYRSWIWWQETGQNITNNTSTVYVELLIDTEQTGNTWATSNAASASITIQGNTSSISSFYSSTADGWTYSAAASPTGRAAERIHSHTVTVAHNADGTMSASLSAAANINSGGFGPGVVSVSGSASLDTIPRRSTIQTFANFTVGSNPSFSLSAASTAFSHRITLSWSSYTAVFNWSAGTSSGTLSMSGRAGDLFTAMATGGTSVSVTATLETISGSTVIGTDTRTVSATTSACTVTANVANFTLTNAFSVSVSALQNSLLKRVLKVYANGVYIMEFENATAGATTMSHTFTVAQRQAIYQQFASSGSSTTLRFDLYTQYGTKRIGAVDNSKTATGSTPAQSLTAISNFNYGDTVTISVSGGDTAALDYETFVLVDSTSVVSLLNTSYTGNLSTYQNAILFNALKNKTSGSFSATVSFRTKSGTIKSIGTGASRTATISVPNTGVYVPSITSFISSEDSSGTNYSVINAMSLGTNIYVQNKSLIKFEAVGVAAGLGADITSVVLRYNFVDNTMTGTTTRTFSLTPTTSGNVQATATITDSRGRTFGLVINTIIRGWALPYISGLSVSRTGANKDKATPSFTAIGSTLNDASGVNKNTLRYRIRYRLLPSGSFATSVTSTATATMSQTYNSELAQTFATGSRYEIEVVAEDKLSGTSFANSPLSLVTLGTIVVPISVSKQGIGVGKVWEQGALDVGGDIYQNGALLKGTEIRSNANAWLSGQVTFQQGSNVTLSQSGSTITINATDTNTTYSAGNGLSLSGTTISLGTPSTLTASTSNALTATSHTHAITTSASGAASTIMQTDGSGDAHARLFRSTYANQSTISGAMAFRVNNSTDNYIRFCSDATAIRTFLSTPSTGITITAGNGLSGGGTLEANRTITLGTPGALTSTSTNAVTATSHTHSIPNNYVQIYGGTLTAGGSGALTSAYTNFDYLIVIGYMDNGLTENGVSMSVPVAFINSSVRQFSLGLAFTSSSVALLNFSLPTTTSIRFDNSAGPYVESIARVYGVKIV